MQDLIKTPRIRKKLEETKALISSNRRNKSLNFLKGQLVRYRSETKKDNESIKRKQIKNEQKETERTERKDKKNSEQTPANSKQLTNIGSRQLVDKQSIQAYESLVDNLLLNINIFKKVFQISKKKRTLIQKLYGWDNIFKNVFFVDQEFRPNLKKQDVITELGLDKKTFAAKNTYNRLRFFLAELINLNSKQQGIEHISQKQKLSESCAKLIGNIKRLSEGSNNEYTKKYISEMKETHYQMLNMKMKIKNRAGELEKIARKTGDIRLNQFYFNEEKNISGIQGFLKERMSK